MENGQIRRIEAIFIRSLYGMFSGWSTYEQCRSEEPQDIRWTKRAIKLDGVAGQ